jgi:competence protein ComEC
MRIVKSFAADFRLLLPAAVILLSSGVGAASPQVTPSERVVNAVNVREEPTVASPILGELRPGEKAELVVSVPHWHRARLLDGTEGFVSKAWTDIVEEHAGPLQFQIHFLDVGTGDAAVIDIGETEIITDGGDSPRVLYDYAQRTGLIDGDIELVVVTHADTDHWRGLVRLLGFDGIHPDPPLVVEFWEPGYDRDCRPLASYDAFIANVANLPGILFRRPLEDSFPPATQTGRIESFTLPSIPEVTFTVLHTAAQPEASNNDCAYRINNASIALMVEIDGFRFLFPGDANGKERAEPSPGTPGHVEELLLALEDSHPGVLRADVLKVPHHGSETASTEAFIDAVDPTYAIISASTRHHLPRHSVLERYELDGLRVILRTDVDRRNDNDHIVCYPDMDRVLQCNYADVLEEN